MTNPPQGSDEHPDDEPAGASRPDPDRFPTAPTPTFPPSGPPGYGTGANPPYGTPSYGQPGGQAPFYGPPGAAPYTATPGYGQAPQYAQPSQYGQPPQYAQSSQYGPSPQAGTPYGVPGYGPPYGAPPPPAQKSKVGLIAVVAAVALLVIVGVVVLVLSQQSTVLDPSAVERDVAAQFQQREGVAIDLDCGETMKVRSGATYTCKGRTADGESVTLKIAITDAKTAAYTWTEP